MIIKILSAISLLVLGFVFGTIFNQFDMVVPQNTTNANLNTALNTKIEVRQIETQRAQYIEKPVTEVKYVERIKTEPVNVHHFSSLEELTNWLDSQNNITTFYLCNDDIILDCDDYANELQRRALEDGYIMSFQVIDAEKYNDLFEMNSIPLNTLHAINLVLIDNGAYYIEPQTGEIRFASYLD